MLTEYLNIQMPYEELQNQSAGTYMLAYTKSSLKDEEIVLENICGVSKEKFIYGTVEMGQLFSFSDM